MKHFCIFSIKIFSWCDLWYIKEMWYICLKSRKTAQFAGTVEYTNCISAEGKRPTPNEYPRYGIKQSDGEAPVMQELWGMQSTPFIAIAPRSTLASSDNIWKSPIYGSNRIVWDLNCVQTKTYAKLNY